MNYLAANLSRLTIIRPRSMRTMFRREFFQADGELIAGAIGPDTGGLTVKEGYDAARTCGLNLIATLKSQLGDLDRVEQVVKVCYLLRNYQLGHASLYFCGIITVLSANRVYCAFGYICQVFGIVNSHVDFKHQHLVMDGCSDLMMEVFDKPVGYHARSAIGTNTLPLDVSVEIEMIVKFKPDVYDDEEDEED
jgi:enamine deaminase RidA (YjgF/YER057c/UK114 family)